MIDSNTSSDSIKPKARAGQSAQKAGGTHCGYCSVQRLCARRLSLSTAAYALKCPNSRLILLVAAKHSSTNRHGERHSLVHELNEYLQIEPDICVEEQCGPVHGQMVRHRLQLHIQQLVSCRLPSSEHTVTARGYPSLTLLCGASNTPLPSRDTV